MTWRQSQIMERTQTKLESTLENVDQAEALVVSEAAKAGFDEDEQGSERHQHAHDEPGVHEHGVGRLGHHGDLQHTGGDVGGRKLRPQTLAALLIEPLLPEGDPCCLTDPFMKPEGLKYLT